MNPSKLNLFKSFVRPFSKFQPSKSLIVPQFGAQFACSSQVSSRCYSSGDMNEQIKRVQQINDYFNQYIDEYYEEEEEEIEEDVAVEQVREFSEDLAKQKLLEIPVEEVVSVLEELKAKNIEVVDIEEENAPFKQIVVASPYTARHASVLIEEVRLHFTKRYDFGKSNPSRVKNQTGWYLLDCHNLVIHIMTEENREKYQLSNLWKTKSLDEQEEDMIKEGWIPPQKPNETQKYRYQRTPVV